MERNEREPFFDNIKFLLIILVVIAHLLEPMMGDSSFAHTVFKVIYLFHMPCFIMITGYFSKHFVSEQGIRLNKLLFFTLCYVIFQLLYRGIEYFCLGKEIAFSFFDAAFGLWYLQVVILFLVTLPFLKKGRKVPVLVAAVLFGVLIGYDPKAGHFLSIMRFFSFAPFFYWGYYWEKSSVTWLKEKKWARPLAVCFFLFCTGFTFLFPQYVSHSLLTGKNSYYAMGILDIGILCKIVWYVAAVIGIYAFFVLVPSRKFFFTKWGERTLQVYLLHIVLLLFYNHYHVADFLLLHFPWQYVAIPAGILLTIVLSWKGFSLPFAALGKCSLHCLGKKD